MASGDLTTLRAVTEDLGLAPGSDAAMLQAWITGASSWITAYISQPVLTTPRTGDVFDGRGGSTMVLPYSPIQSIQRLAIDGKTIVRATPGASDAGYFLDTRGILRLRGLTFTRGIGNVEIDYTSGWPTVPPALERACVRIVGWRYKEKDRLGHSSKTIGTETVAFQTAAAAEDVLKILNQYARVVPA